MTKPLSPNAPENLPPLRTGQPPEPNSDGTSDPWNKPFPRVAPVLPKTVSDD